MKKARKAGKYVGKYDPAVVLGSACVHLQRLSECDLLAEAQDYVYEIDKQTFHRAVLRAKAQGRTRVMDALGDVLKLLNAVPYLQGDDQFTQYKAGLAPVLEHLHGMGGVQ